MHTQARRSGVEVRYGIASVTAHRRADLTQKTSRIRSTTDSLRRAPRLPAQFSSAAYRTAVTGTFEIRTSWLITLRRNIDSRA
jgi:hypothetical protein